MPSSLPYPSVVTVPYRILYYKGAALAAAELSGTVRWPEVGAALRALYLDPRWTPGSSVLWDGTRMTSVDVAPTDLPDVRKAFEDVAEAREGGRTAFLVGPGEDMDLWALFPRLGPRCTRRVATFDCREEALAFLGWEALPEDSEVIAASPPPPPTQ